MFDDLKCLQEKASNHDLELIVVGGAVRDRLIFNTPSKDIDIEVHPFQSGENIQLFESRILKFKESFKYKDLPFSIFSFSKKIYEIEIGPPRIEHNTGCSKPSRVLSTILKRSASPAAHAHGLRRISKFQHEWRPRPPRSSP